MTQPTIYHALTNENIATPLDPGDQVIYPAGTEHLQCAQLDQNYSNIKTAHLTYKNMDQALLGLIILNIDPIYTRGIIKEAALYKQQNSLISLRTSIIHMHASPPPI